MKKHKHYYKGIPAVYAAKKNAISREAFYYRVRRGWTIKRAVETPVFGNQKRYKWIITNYKNKTFDSASALAEYLGVTKNKIIGQAYRHGLSFTIGKYIIERR